MVARNYDRLLEVAEDLQAYSGYLDTEDKKQLALKRGALREAVRVVVYDLYREGPDHGALPVSVAADFDRIARANTHSAGAVAEAREAVLRGIRARSGTHPALHFVIRWGPPALMVAAACAYIYFRVEGR
jgi:hypothetical protein